jgi:hypothetical protein
VPVPIPLMGAGGSKRKRRDDQPAAFDFRGRVALVERISGGKLPSHLSLAIAQMDEHERNLMRAARMAAKVVDTPYAAVFGKASWHDMQDPLYGGKMRLETIQRIHEAYDPAILASILPDYVESPKSHLAGLPQQLSPGALAAVARTHPVGTAQRLGNALASLRPLRNFNLEMHEGLGLATHLARSKVNITQYGKNLQAIMNWAEATGRTGEADWSEWALLALGATKAKVRLDTPTLIAEFLLPQTTAAGKGHAVPGGALGAAPGAVQGVDRPYFVPEGKFWPEQARLAVSGLAFGLNSEQKDLFTTIKELEQQTALSETAFERSWFGRNVVTPTLNFLSDAQTFAYRGFLDGIVAPVVLAEREITAALPGGQTFSGAFQQTQHERQAIIQRLNDTGSLAHGFEMKGWQANAFDFAVAWYADPLNIAGYALKVRSLAHLEPYLRSGQSLTGSALSRLANHSDSAIQAATRFNEFQAGRFSSRVDKFVQSKMAGKLFNAAWDTEEAFDRTIRNLGHTYAPLDREYMYGLRELMLKDGRSALSRAEFEDALRSQLVGWAPEGSLAARALDRRGFASVKTDKALRDIPDNSVRRVSRELGLEINQDTRMLFDPGTASHAEIPKRAGLRQRTALNAEAATAGEVGKGRRTMTMNPGRTFNLHNEPLEYTRLHLNRWGEYTDAEVAQHQAQLAGILNAGVRAEDRAFDFIEETNREGLRRYIKAKGWKLSEEAQSEMESAIFEPFYAQRNPPPLFGYVPDAEIGLRPLLKPTLETSLKNTLHVPDPVLIKQQARRFVGMRDELKTELRRAIRKAGPRISDAERTKLEAKLSQVDLGIRDVARAYRRLWKAGAVARPGYITRVILLDENARFIAVSSIAERFLSHRMGVAGRALDRTGIFDSVIDLGDGEVLTIPRAGSRKWFGDEPLASNTMRETELLEEAMADAEQRRLAFKPTGGYGALDPMDPKISPAYHLKNWAKQLTEDLGLSHPGRVALESIKRGDSVEETAREVFRYGRTPDGFIVTQTRLGIDPADLGEWADDVAAQAHYYTLGRKEIAAAALDRKIGDNFADELNRMVPKGERPTVHGPEVQAAIGGKGNVNPATALTNWAYKTFVSHPEDVLNRQPFYRTMKRRAEVAAYRRARDVGVTTAPEDLKRIVDQASRSFALRQVQRIMFDFTRQHRLGELVQTAIPFPQPFVEGYSAWGHIALVRRPQTYSHVRQLFQLGVNSGFISKDENGEWRIPLWPHRYVLAAMRAVPFLNKFALPEGVSNLYAPLSAMNMLTSTTIPIPDVGPLKPFAGVPLPVPGFDPVAATVLQHLFANSNNDQIVALLFQYGPNSQFIPAPIQAIGRAFVPGSKLNEDYVNNRALDFLAYYQKAGLDKDENGNPVPFDELKARALSDAQQLVRATSVAQLLGPTTSRPEFETQDLENEWRGLVEAQGWEAGTKAFNEKYDYRYTAVTIGKTLYSDVYQGNKVPRVPPSEFVAKMMALDNPTMKLVTQNYQPWFGLLLVGADQDVANDFDFAYYSRQIAAGHLKGKSLWRARYDTEAAAAWAAVDNWYKTVWNPQWEKIADGHGIYDPIYPAMQQQRREFYTELAHRFPVFAAEELKQIHDPQGRAVGYDRAYEDANPPTEVVYNDARALAQIPEIQQFPGIQALNFYLDERDKIAKIMDERGYSDITQVSAERDGLTARFDKLTATIEKRWGPEASRIIGVYFEDDLRGLETQQAQAERTVPTEQLEAYHGLETRWRKLKDAAYRDYDTPSEKSAGYQHIQTFLNNQWMNNRKALRVWWDVNYPEGSPDRRDYMNALALRPPEFLSAWDLHLMGLPVNKQVLKLINQVGDARLEIQRRKEADPALETGVLYQALDKSVAAAAKKVPAFAKWVEATNTLGWSVKAAGLTGQPGKLGQAWTAVYEVAGEVQKIMDARDLHGIAYGSDSDKQWYAYVRSSILKAITSEVMKEVPAFKRQWYDLQEDYGDPLIELFLPDTYFRPGG